MYIFNKGHAIFHRRIKEKCMQFLTVSESERERQTDRQTCFVIYNFRVAKHADRITSLHVFRLLLTFNYEATKVPKTQASHFVCEQLECPEEVHARLLEAPNRTCLFLQSEEDAQIWHERTKRRIE